MKKLDTKSVLKITMPISVTSIIFYQPSPPENNANEIKIDSKENSSKNYLNYWSALGLAWLPFSVALEKLGPPKLK